MTTHHFLPLTPQDRGDMLAHLGHDAWEGLVQHIPGQLRAKALALPPGVGEQEVVEQVQGLAQANRVAGSRCFLGMGAYQRFSPSAIDALLQRAEFYTAYTPYQPEVSQGTLQATYEFQSMICALTGLDVANASLYDGSTAVPEAAMMACRITGRSHILLSEGLHPHALEVMRTYAKGEGLELRLVPLKEGRTDLAALESMVGPEVACVVVACPNVLGQVEDMAPLGVAAKAHGGLFVASVDPVSLALLAPPAEYGADIAIGEAQGLGLPLAYGGPYVGFMACTAKHFRQLPGRIVGATVDEAGRKVYTLTLQTREQHIRREKATSNICTNQALMALGATLYLALAGPEGLREVAEVGVARAHHLAGLLCELPGVSLAEGGAFLQEFVVRLPLPAEQVAEAMAKRGFLAGVPLGSHWPERGHHLLVAVTECNRPQDLEAYREALGEVLGQA